MTWRATSARSPPEWTYRPRPPGRTQTPRRRAFPVYFTSLTHGTREVFKWENSHGFSISKDNRLKVELGKALR